MFEVVEEGLIVNGMLVPAWAIVSVVVVFVSLIWAMAPMLGALGGSPSAKAFDAMIQHKRERHIKWVEEHGGCPCFLHPKKEGLDQFDPSCEIHRHMRAKSPDI